MPSFDVVKNWDNPGSYRTEAVKGMFTLEQASLSKHFKGNIPFENEPWQIGVIVGRSGTGKTSIAKELFPAEYICNLRYEAKSILDDFDPELSVQEVTQALSSVGFASPPDWLKSYEQLSQGEKMRVDIARALTLERNFIVFDEFTSVIDREIAKIACAAISKAIRRSSKKFIAVTCHYDIIDWLEPDWVFNTDTMSFLKKKWQRPQITISVHKSSAHAWPMFRDFHYLNREIHEAADCYIAFYQNRAVAFIATVFNPRKYYQVSRLVVLPDYQGVGIGKRLLNWLAERYKREGRPPLFIITSNPQLRNLAKGGWLLVRAGRASAYGKFSKERGYRRETQSRNRLTMSFRFVGQLHSSAASEDEASMF